MITKCAWCDKTLKEETGDNPGLVSYGICWNCSAALQKAARRKKQSISANDLFDAFGLGPGAHGRDRVS